MNQVPKHIFRLETETLNIQTFDKTEVPQRPCFSIYLCLSPQNLSYNIIKLEVLCSVLLL